jgi:hypothetical protein
VSRALVAFDEGAKVLIDADVDTNEAPHLGSTICWRSSAWTR